MCKAVSMHWNDGTTLRQGHGECAATAVDGVDDDDEEEEQVEEEDEEHEEQRRENNKWKCENVQKIYKTLNVKIGRHPLFS